MSTTSAPTTTPVPEPATPAGPSPAPGRRLRPLAVGLAVALVVAGSSAIAAGVADGNSQRAPVEIVQDGRWGGPDVFEHSVPPPGDLQPAGPRYGSADSMERWAAVTG